MTRPAPSELELPLVRSLVQSLVHSIDRRLTALKKALERFEEEPSGEPLHDLRVALRRTAALGGLFGGFPDQADGESVRTLARDLRRHLSSARQDEVSRFLLAELAREELAAEAERTLRVWPKPDSIRARDVAGACRPALTALSAWRRRAAGWRPARAGARRLAKTLEKRIRRLRKKLLGTGLPTRKTLHRQRVRTKALRYRLELLEGALPAAARCLYAARRAQEAMGAANDWACLLSDLKRRADPSRVDPARKKPRRKAVPPAAREGLVDLVEGRRKRYLAAARNEARVLLRVLRKTTLELP